MFVCLHKRTIRFELPISISIDQSDVMQLFASCMEEEVSQSASRIEGTQPIALTEIVGRFFLLQHRPRYTLAKKRANYQGMFIP